MRGSFYVYVHLRADDGLPFYVGKGKGPRAWSASTRNKFWRHVNKKHKRLVMLLWEGLTEERAFELEQKAIADLRAYSPDTMTNLTDGGEGYANAAGISTKKSEILEFLRANGRAPSMQLSEERSLCHTLHNYCCPTRATFDPEFLSACRQLGYGKKSVAPWIVEENRRKKQEIRDFFHINGRFPSQHVPEEYRVYTWLATYCSKTASAYDPEFRSWAESVGYGRKKTSP